ncbi:MAG: hypothetical protein KZQ76_03520 [Candidatus Thiodiazotropha sp. (ex Epidulcina cf. delphinae)]|nr:hypothetical protein [Candidatus Thiodiazotropha sp. (ex Epidulcina cf. delphinae)]
MEITAFITALVLFGLYLIFKSTRIGAAAKSKADDVQERIETVLNLPQESDGAWQNEPATQVMMQELGERGIRLNSVLTKGQTMNVLGLFSPSDGRQVDILKHFNIPYSFKMNQTMAYYLIRELFSDPQKVVEWNNRPPTTTVRLGLLFLAGKPVNGLTHVEAQTRLDQLAMENPAKYQEWKQVDRLFLETNNPDIRAKYQVRKTTWKRFFENYDALKEAGITPRAMCGENIIEHSLRKNNKALASAKIRNAMQPASGERLEETPLAKIT